MEYIIAEVLKDCSDAIQNIEKRSLQERGKRLSQELNPKDGNFLQIARDGQK